MFKCVRKAAGRAPRPSSAWLLGPGIAVGLLLSGGLSQAEGPSSTAAPSRAPASAAATPRETVTSTVPATSASGAKASAAHTTARVGSARPSAYRGWHAPNPETSAPLDPRGRPKLVLVSLNTKDRVELEALTDQGGFSASDLDRAAFVLREPSSGNEHPMEPRTLDLVYQIQLHFHAQELRVISGYRTPHGHTSQHGRGRAIDFIVPGATDSEVARFARQMGYVGVGIYPSSGFVHLDARDRSYFWVDSSAPGRRNRERGILGDSAAKADAQASARGEHGTPLSPLGTDVDLVLRTRRSSGAVDQELDDEDEEQDPGGG